MDKFESVSDRVILPVLGLTTALFLYSIKASQLSGMSMGFAGSIREGQSFFFPHHLLHQPILEALYRIIGSSSCDAICAGQLYGIFWGVVAVLAIYTLAHHATKSRFVAAITVIFTVASHGFLVFSTQLEPYVPMLGMSTLLVAILVLNEGPPFSWKLNALFVAVFALSLFHHQAMVVFLIPMAYYAVSVSGHAGLAWFLKITFATGVPVLLTFIAVFWSYNPSDGPIQFIRWLMYYSVVLDTSHGGFLIYFTDGYFVERIVSAARAITRLFLVLPGSDIDFGGIESDAGERRKLARILFATTLFMIFLWNTVQVARHKSHASIRIFLLIWLATFGLFGFWWKADVYKFFMPVITPMALLTALTVNDFATSIEHRVLRGTVALTAVAVALLMLFSNMQTTVLKLHESRGAIFEQARILHEARPEGCVAYTRRYLGSTLGYYFGGPNRPFNFMFKKHFYSTVDPAVSETLGTRTDFEGDSCGVIPLYYVSREYFAHGAMQAVSRRLEPENWGDFVTWFFEVMPEENPPGITFSKFWTIEGASGDRFLIFDRTVRVSDESLNSLLNKIEDLDPATAEGSFSPDALEVVRFRLLAFGYN